MEGHTQHRIVSADRVTNCLVITFDDGKCALFSASLLYAILPEAELVTEEDEGDCDA